MSGISSARLLIGFKLQPFRLQRMMLSSWLNQKGEEAKTQEPDSLHTTPRPSFSSPMADAAQPSRVSTEGKLPAAAAAPLPAAYTTPHDILLSELHGTFFRSDTPSDPALDAAPQVPAKEAAHQSASRLPSSEVLMDPFDGSVLGVLLPQGQGSDSQNPSQVNLTTNQPENGATGMNANPAGSEAVWSQLSRVLDIQGEISKMHLDIEMIGMNKTRSGSDNLKGKNSHWKGHRKAPPENVSPSGREDISGVNWPRKRAISTVSTISSSGEQEGDEAGVNFQDDEEEKTRIRGEEFAKLSSQFEGRKEAIHGIMAKLDDLSQVLGEFHELPIPDIEFPASRNASLGIAPLPTEPELKSGGPSGRNSRLSGGSTSRNIEGTLHHATTLSLAVPPLQRAMSETAALSIPPSTLQRRKNVPTLLVNSMELDRKPHVTESPVSAGFKLSFDGQ